MNEIYLDNSMAARPSEKTVSIMQSYFTKKWGNLSSPHSFGQSVQADILKGYQKIYDLLGASDEDTILFTSSACEAINHVIQSEYFTISLDTGRNHFVSTHIDNAPQLMAIGRIEDLGGKATWVMPNAEGIITKDAIANAITPRSALVSITWASGITGVIQPAAEIADVCRERGVKLHLDATHVLGKVYFDLNDIGADFISFGGEAIHAPIGTGALYIKRGTKLAPFILGGIEQGGLRAGPYSTALFMGFANACSEASDARDLVCTEVARFRDKFEEGIVSKIPNSTVFFQDVDRLANVTTMGFSGMVSEALLYYLEKKGLYACIGGGQQQQIGLILQAAQIPKLTANSAVSFSFSRETTEENVERAIDIVCDTVKTLRKTSEYISS